jgi:hypothetical protein
MFEGSYRISGRRSRHLQPRKLPWPLPSCSSGIFRSRLRSRRTSAVMVELTFIPLTHTYIFSINPTSLWKSYHISLIVQFLFLFNYQSIALLSLTEIQMDYTHMRYAWGYTNGTGAIWKPMQRRYFSISCIYFLFSDYKGYYNLAVIGATEKCEPG